MKIHNYLKLAVLSLCCLVIVPQVHATDSEPMAMLREVTNSMIQRLTADKVKVQEDPEYVFKLADELLVPKADFNEMSKRVLAVYWRKATPKQRADFATEFQNLVVHTYATAFRSYKDEQVEVTGERYGRQNKNLVEVNTKIKQTEGPDIVVNYRMIKREQGWKVYDMNVEGVSLVSSFRSQFADKLRRDGIDAVIADLKTKNAEEQKKIDVKRGSR